MTLSFDESRLCDMLEGLPPTLRAAFAASCAERLAPAYVRFAAVREGGAPGTLRDALSALWEDLLGERAFTSDAITALVAAVMEQIPDEDEEPWVDEQSAAQDAASAVAYALRCRQTGESSEAAWSGRCVYEVLDHFVINRQEIDTNQRGAEAQVLANPLVQAELRRQERDLDALAQSDDHRRTVGMLRERSIAESQLVFGGVAY